MNKAIREPIRSDLVVIDGVGLLPVASEVHPRSIERALAQEGGPVLGADTMRFMARVDEELVDPAERAAEKRASRDADRRALASGEKSLEKLWHENRAMARVLARGRIDLAASRSLG